MAVKHGDKVKVEYEGRLEDGTIFDSSQAHDQTLEFEVGAGEVIPGFEHGALGLNVGEEREVTIKPENAYGLVNPQLIKKIPLSAIPNGEKLKVGMRILVGRQGEQQIPAVVAEVNPKEVTIDLNHPLAGKTLIFKIKVVEIGN